MYLRDIQSGALCIPAWTLGGNEQWCILGTNGSGKTRLAELLAGHRKPERGTIAERPEGASLVSLETQQALYEEELRRDESDIINHVDEGRSVRTLLGVDDAGEQGAVFRAWVQTMRLTHLLDRGYRRLSSGEARALLLLREILQGPELLILDEPFESLDASARGTLVEVCGRLCSQGRQLILLVGRLEDVPAFATHVALLHRGRLLMAGPRAEVLEAPEVAQLLHFDRAGAPPLPPPPPIDTPPIGPLLALHDGAVRYDDEHQFRGLDWTLAPGEHTLITGPNGAGKSTLLQLITGDHPQCYTNELTVFGMRRGTGESIWDIKRHIGFVSSALHRDYRVGADVLTTVVSGLYDTIGVYQHVPESDRRRARDWLSLLGLVGEARTPLRAMPYGHQRLLLIARALIKQPPLLILDEPAQGLDDPNRLLVLAFVEQLAALERTTLLMVSHRADEHLSLFRQHVRFEPSDEPGVRYHVTVETRRGGPAHPNPGPHGASEAV